MSDLALPSLAWPPAPDELSGMTGLAELPTRLNAVLALAGQGADATQRKPVTDALKAISQETRRELITAFEAEPDTARPLTHGLAWLTDCLVNAAIRAAAQLNGLDEIPFAVMAVGGYGRGEMAPHSDVDLLFVLPSKPHPKATDCVETTLYLLWDLKLKIGHATRSISECVALGRQDATIQTTLLEMRHLAGKPRLASKLQDRLKAELFSAPARDFIEAKLTERDNRHERQGGQRYMLEPNVKEAKGGLRDLQSLYWIGKYVTGMESGAEMVAAGLLTQDEYQSFVEAERFLWAVRCHLHIIAGRPTDQLTFDMQVQVAERMGYQDGQGRRGVERFMQQYFRHATHVGDLTRIFLSGLEARHVKRESRLAGLFRRKPRLRQGFELVHGRLQVAEPDSFFEDRLNLLRVFDEALRTGALIHPDTMREVAARLDRFDEKFRQDRAAARIFLMALLKRGDPARLLTRMKELGVLSAYIPEFEPVIAMMQFNMYHHYTVDEHSIRCVAELALIEQGELDEDLPLCSEIMSRTINRRVLYLAVLVHDIGKGREEDHSILGARLARSVATRLGFRRSEIATVEWLVRYHLLMSDTAQKRDLSDPRTIRDFAKAVKNRANLDLLLVLTVCDIRGVGPGVWNNWKAQLLRQLHRETAHALENGMEAINREQRGSEAKAALRARLTDWSEAEKRAEIKRHYPPYWQGLPSETHEVFARMLKGLNAHELGIDLHPDEDRDATRAAFALAEHPGIFARITGALALVGANVVDARSFTTRDGYTTAVFWIQDADGHPYEHARLPRLRQMIDKILREERVPEDALQSRDQIKRRERAFRVPTSITFDNDGSDIYTIIEVDTRDRPGLLFDLARSLAAANVNIVSTVIATYGAQAVDSFYVKDMFGLKFFEASRQRNLEKRLRAAIAEGSQRAGM